MRVSRFATSVVLTLICLTVPAQYLPAQAEEPCTGENCQSPEGQGSGHDCEHDKSEQTVS